MAALRKKKVSKRVSARKPKSKKRTRAKPRRRTAKKTKKFSFLRFFVKLFGSFFLLGALVLAAWLWTLDGRIQSRFNTPFKSIPAHLYAKPYTLTTGDVTDLTDIEAVLLSKGYRHVDNIAKPGDFAFAGKVIDIYQQPTPASKDAQAIRVVLGEGRIQKMTNHQDAKLVNQLEFDAKLIGNLMTGPIEDRILLSIHQVPELLLDALITMEDKRFASHHGVDPMGILRAMVQNLRHGQVTQGGSTLTQQLVKNLYLDNSRTLKRKVNEAAMALIIEWRYDKSQILERYINTIFLGQSGNRAIHGFGLAARYYYDRKLKDLNPAQIAMLVGMIPAPSAYNPFRNATRAKTRRNLVLQTLHKNGFISAGEVDLYMKTSLGLAQAKKTAANRYGAFTDLLNRQLGENYEPSYLQEGGLNVYSTLDETIQRTAQMRFAQALSELEKQHNIDADTLQGAMIILEPSSGEILALVGDRYGKTGSFNRALDAKRPIGSLVKPAVYLTALLNPGRYSTVSFIEDAPLSIDLQTGETWQPNNYDNIYHGRLNLHDALINSYNIPAVKVGLDVGLDAVVTTLHRLGVNSNLPLYPSLLLGAVDLSLLEVAQMYQTLANSGKQLPLTSLRKVANRKQQVLTRHQSKGEQMVNANANFILVDLLQDVASQGTARALTQLMPNTQLAGKTGTTNDYRDSWFAGFGENYLAIVWVGKDDNTSTGLTGASGALRAWANVMSAIDLHSLAPDLPVGVSEVEVDLANGELAVANCTQETATRYFVSGYEPISNSECSQVVDRVGGWLEKWFGSGRTERPQQQRKIPVIDPFAGEEDFGR